MQVLLSCSSPVVFLNNYIKSTIFFLVSWAIQTFSSTIKGLGAHQIHGHHRLMYALLYSLALFFLACLALCLLDILNRTTFIFSHYCSLSHSIRFLCIFWVPGVLLNNYTNELSSFPHFEQVNFLASHHNLDASVIHRHRELDLPSYFSS